MNKKAVLVVLLALVLTFAMGGIALAGGWSAIVAPGSHSPDTGSWGSDQNPHGGYTTSTNKCRVCHAVHLANTNSWRLLRDTSRGTECDYCHDGTSGLSAARPYRARSWTIRGQHTLQSTVVPDSTLSLGGGLSCGWCHSVHGANTLDGAETTAAGWDGKILKEDPAGDGGNVETTGLASLTATFPVDSGDKLKTAYCSDCHNLNSNWDAEGGDDNTATATRPNSRSHVQGPAADGAMEVYGNASETVAWGDTQSGCTDCHSATTGGNQISDDVNSAFPHESKGGKLLKDSYLQDNASSPATATNNGARVVPAMDDVCLGCHDNPFNGGVGETF